MSDSAGFCPYCGTSLIEGQQFCGTCGHRLPGVAGPPPGAPVAPAPAPVAPPRAGAIAPSPRHQTSGGSGAASWANIGDALGLAVLPTLIWLGVTLLVTFLVSEAARSQLYGVGGGSAVGMIGASFAEGILASGSGVIGALLAGLGFQVGAGGSAGALGTSTNVNAAVTVGLVPFSMLTTYAVVIGRRSRTLARNRGGSNLTEFVGPAVLGAAIAGLAIYLGALLLSTSLGGALDSASGAAGAAVTVRGGPTMAGLLFVLFPSLAAGAIVGALAGGGWPLLLARLQPHLAQPAAVRFVGGLPLLLYGVAGYLVALAVAAVLATLLLLVLAIGNGADVVAVIRLLPAVLLLMPNGVSVLTLAGTGTQLGLAATGAAAASVPTSTGSLWNLPLEWVAAGLVALALPGFFAGVIARSRIPQATPGRVATVGALTGIIALVGAVLAVPSFTGQGQVFVTSVAGSTKLVFDLGQAVLVGGVAIIGLALVGFRYGGGAAAHVPDVEEALRR